MKQRYYSLDVFRGATVALMILVNNPGSWEHIFSPLDHAAWHGLTPTDLVFPFFLFAVGNAMAFVMPRFREGGPALFWPKVIKRTVLIFAIGLFINWWPFVKWSDGQLVFKYWVSPDHPDTGIRILGVLQRIALAYFFASVLVFYLRKKALLYVGGIILLGYWFVCWYFGDEDPYSLAHWFGTAVDRSILGVAHMYKGEGVPFDPEGLASTAPAVVQVILGYMAGNYIRQQGAQGQSLYRTLSVLFVAATFLCVAGWFWGLGFPVNKKIWTSSFVLATTGLALATIAVMIWFLEAKQVKNGATRFFDVFGKNPLFIFVLSGVLPRVLGLIRLSDGSDPLNWFYRHVCAPLPGPPEWGSLLYAVITVLVFWAICYFLDKKKIYIKV